MGIHKLVLDFKKAYDSARKETFYNILIESGYPHESRKASNILFEFNHWRSSGKQIFVWPLSY